ATTISRTSRAPARSCTTARPIIPAPRTKTFIPMIFASFPPVWPSCLKQNLQPELNHARIFSYFQYLPEGRVCEVSVGVRQLRVIPGIVELRPELGVPPFVDGCLLRNYQVCIADCRSTAECVRHVPKNARIWIGNIRSIDQEGSIVRSVCS